MRRVRRMSGARAREPFGSIWLPDGRLGLMRHAAQARASRTTSPTAGRVGRFQDQCQPFVKR